MLSAVNVAYDVTEQRPFLQFQIIGLAMTLVAVLCAILAIGVLLLLPPAIDFLGLSSHGGGLIHTAGLAMLIGFFFVAIVLLYRFGPSRPEPPRPRITPGAALATVLWLIASELLSVYVSRIGSIWRDLWIARGRGWRDAVVLYVCLRRPAWRRVERTIGRDARSRIVVCPATAIGITGTWTGDW